MADVEMENQPAEQEVKEEAAEVAVAEVKEESTVEETEKAPAEEASIGEDPEYAENEEYKKLRDQQINPSVAVALIKLYEQTEMTPEDVDERAIEMLRSFANEQACYIIEELRKSELFGVQNRAQYLMSVMRNFRDRVRNFGATTVMGGSLIVGPEKEKIQSILERTGYSLEVTVGQRKYGGPPPEWEGPATGPEGHGFEIYIGHIPHEIFEDELIPLFEQPGKIWDLRLMMDPLTGKNRGYAFLTYCDKESAKQAAKQFDGHEIATGKTLKVNVSVANRRLFIGNIPKSKSKEEILEELRKHTDGVMDVIIYSNPDASDRFKNRGFCFADFTDHKSASDAKRKFTQGKNKQIRPFNCDLVVDWAEQQEEPDDETMAKVKVIYIRNLKEAVTEEKLQEVFGGYGEVERLKKIKDYAFVHYKEREPAVKAIEEQNGKEWEGVNIEVSLAKPMGDKKKPRGRGRGFGSPGFRGGASNMYPNRGGYDMYPGGYDMYGGGGGYGGGYGGYGDYGGSYGGGYGMDFGGGYGGGYGGFDSGFGGGGYGGGRGGRGRGGGRGRSMGGGRGGRGGNRGRGKRPGDWNGGPASKRDNGADFTSDVNMSSF